MGKDFGANLYKAEIDYLIDYEWAMTAEDILWRRTKHGLRLTESQQAVLGDYVQQRLADAEGKQNLLASA